VKERLLPLALALAALGLFWLLLFPKPAPRSDEAAHPLSTERAPAGYLGLVRWLAASHVPTLAWRSRYERLAVPGPALPDERGNLMVVSLPFAMPMRLGEAAALDAWLRKGNTLLVMAALDDTPRWAIAAPGRFDAQLLAVAHLQFEVIHLPAGKRGDAARLREAIEDTLAGAHVDVRPVRTAGSSHPMFAGVSRIATHTELPASRWRGSAPDPGPVLEVARRADSGDAAIWMRSFGAGTIVVSGYASPLSNQRLGEGDNARWFANLVATQLGPRGRVVFDDAHQGGVDDYDPQRFYGDPRLRRTLGWLVLLWALWVFGSRALAPARPPAPRIDDTALLAVTADFYAGVLKPAVAGERLCAHFFDAIRRRLGQPENGQPVWAWLEGHGRVSAAEIDELRRLHGRAQAGRRLDLQRLHALLHDLSGKIA
jgi:hypothetical protein